MHGARAIPSILLLLAALAPAASAGFIPALYFLAPPTDLAGDGGLDLETPDGNESSSAVVTWLPADAPSQVFIALDAAGADRVLGRAFVGLWGDLSAAQGNLSATLVFVSTEGRTVVAQASRSVSTDPNSVPDPTSLVPPDPSDPQAALLHVAGQVLPALQHPPMLLDFGILDLEVPDDAVVGLELRLTEDNATGLPPGGLARVQYDAAPTPSFVYVPWWYETPEQPTNSGSGGSVPSTGGTGGSGGSGGSSAPSGEDEPTSSGKDSPGPALGVVLVAVGAVALALRRRA